MKLDHLVLLATLVFSANAGAQIVEPGISAKYRSDNAVVNYDFSVVYNASGAMEPWIRDKGICPAPLSGDSCKPVDLVVLNPTNVLRSQNSLQLTGVNLVRSATYATKLALACKAGGALTIEADIANYETTLARSALDLDERPQPLRIVSFSKDLKVRNFTLGQFYDGGDQYQVGVRTNINENAKPDDPADTRRLGGSFQEPLKSSTSAILVPSALRNQIRLQKVVFTLSSNGVGRLYLSDLDNAMYLATEVSNGFGNSSGSQYFSNWTNNAYLNLGNENLLASTFLNVATSDGSPTDAAKTEFNRKSANGSNLAECANDCVNEPNRYWKGEFKRLAIYCKEVPKEEILGAGTANVISNIIPAPVDIAVASISDAGIEKAQIIYTRLTGVKKAATEKVITDMADLIKSGNLVGAAALATEDAQFINTTVRDFAAKMSNRAETINVPLNDFIATFMGIARDNIPATEALTGNYFYMANRDPNVNPRTGMVGGGPWPSAPVPGRLIEDVLRSNNHYESLETGRYDLNAVLIKTRQKVLNAKAASQGGLQAVDMPDPAGVLTSRQWLKEHAFAGTNRRLIEFSLREFLCTPIEMAADAGGPDDVVGPDIDRLPGGDNSKYMNNCRSCHTILDSFRPAFAEWTFGKDFPKNVNYTDDIADTDDEDVAMGMKKDDRFAGVSFKYNKEADKDPSKVIYPDGRRTINSKWVNYALTGSNKINFQFPEEMTSGTGVNSFGLLLSRSPKFNKCMAERAFRQVCKRDVVSTDATLINTAANAFRNANYNMKVLFQNIVVGDQCLGGAN